MSFKYEDYVGHYFFKYVIYSMFFCFFLWYSSSTHTRPVNTETSYPDYHMSWLHLPAQWQEQVGRGTAGPMMGWISQGLQPSTGCLLVPIKRWLMDFAQFYSCFQQEI